VLEVAKHAILNDKPKHPAPENVPIAAVLFSYFEEYAQFTPGARTQKLALDRWSQFWGNQIVAAITPSEQAQFRKWLGHGRLADTTVNRILSAGKAALNYAVENGRLTHFPKIILVESGGVGLTRPPLGTPVTVENAARLLDAIESRHLMVFVVILLNTMARPAAALDLRRKQFDSSQNTIALNPEGRRQTKKFRPTLLVTPTLHKWLDIDVPANQHYVLFGGKPVQYVNTAWENAVRAAGLPDKTTPYSIRHGIARELKRRKVPLEQRSYFLGHLPQGSARTTAIYAPLDAHDCTEAVSALEDIMNELRVLLRRGDLDNPFALNAGDSEKRRYGIWLSEPKRSELEQLVMEQIGVMEISRRMQISTTLVYRYRERLLGRTRLR